MMMLMVMTMRNMTTKTQGCKEGREKLQLMRMRKKMTTEKGMMKPWVQSLDGVLNLYKVKRCGEWGAMRAPEAPGGPTCIATPQC